jgi:hypothetical protein
MAGTHLDHDGVAREQRGRDGVEHVVEGVVPRHDGAEHPARVPLDPGLLEEEHATGRARLGREPALTLGWVRLGLGLRLRLGWGWGWG